MSDKGVIKQIIGAVIDVEFDKDQIPNIYDALVVNENNLVLETQQQLGDGVVRTVAMGTTEGLKRGLDVENTKAPISVPVGEATLGRIMNVLGDPIDMKGDVQTKERMHSFFCLNVPFHIDRITQNIHNSAKCCFTNRHTNWGFCVLNIEPSF